jgi:serine/threonine protein kinase
MTTDFTSGSKPERLKQLLALGLEESKAKKHTPSASPLDLFMEKPGSRIGCYELKHLLGEGAMAVVYLAQQHHPVKRYVAVKILKPGMDSKAIIARFEAERQALALLDHPSIAHIYDAGATEDKRPYFAMEYVEGSSITNYCDHYKLTIEERLHLFLRVCHAVHHAHQKGIIHRDIKPSNILVTTHEDQAIPKIIDFGVAKAIAQPLTERTLVTEQGQLFGTPEYMSPEQAVGAGDDIDTRSDIYSLGVLLYVLLTGVLPFESDTLREGGIEHVRKVICETDPKTPSTRLTKLGEKAAAIAQNRRTKIATLAKYLHKELEWIPLKAMRKERTERYRSTAELADDIENYLKGAPLIAGPLSHVYRLRKFIRRNRALVTGISAVLTVLIVGIIVSTLFAIRVERALSQAQAVSDFLENDVLGSVSQARFGEATVCFVLDTASERLQGKFEDQPLVEASLRSKLAQTYRDLGEAQKAEQHYLDAIRIYKQYYGERHSSVLTQLWGLAWVYGDQGRLREMEALSAQCGFPFIKAVAQGGLGKYQEAASFYERRLPVANEEERPFCLCNLACNYAALGRYEEAERLFVEGLAEWPEESNWRITYSSDLADMYRVQGRHKEAEQLFEKGKTLEMLRSIKGDEHHGTLSFTCRLARLYIDQNRLEEAEKLLREALTIARRRLRLEHPEILDLVHARAVLHAKQKHYDQAETFFEEALKGMKRQLSEDHPDTLETKNDLAVLYKEQGDYDKAEPLLIEAVEGRRLKLGDTHPHTLQSLNNLIDLYDIWNKPEQANQWRGHLALE